ncbi:tail fiber assembly protein [Photorhabdus noenieputensis]|uniref:tail fiber assembly protein n=1 Tax=Photorhabdus noenieputensis TaxID=1208607 RepID=UPI0028A127F8|nr:tail fiber assembly protein [Photorhabdus noenieputensis]
MNKVKIGIFLDSADFEIATDADKAVLLEWKKYRVLLTRVDVNQAPDVEWPEVPKTASKITTFTQFQ